MQNNTRKHRIINIALQLLEKQIKSDPILSRHQYKREIIFVYS